MGDRNVLVRHDPKRRRPIEGLRRHVQARRDVGVVAMLATMHPLSLHRVLACLALGAAAEPIDRRPTQRIRVAQTKYRDSQYYGAEQRFTQLRVQLDTSFPICRSPQSQFDRLRTDATNLGANAFFKSTQNA